MTSANNLPANSGNGTVSPRIDKISAQPSHERIGASRLILSLLSLAVFASALGVVYAKHENRKLFMELQVLQTTRDAMNVEWGQLQLEQSTLATHARIDTVARTKLGMIAPVPETVVIVKP